MKLIALRDYEARVAAYTDELLGAVECQKGQKLNASKWFKYAPVSQQLMAPSTVSCKKIANTIQILTENSYYSFDIMGDLAFGKSFNMLKDGKDNYFLSTTHMNMVLIGIFSVSLVWDSDSWASRGGQPPLI